MTPPDSEQSQLDRIEKNLTQLLLIITGQGGKKQDIENSIFYRLDAHDRFRKIILRILWLSLATLTTTFVSSLLLS